MPAITSLKFEIFGRVQGVSFRYYTRIKANELHLVGGCRNTAEGTVEGIAQGQKEAIDIFKQWLRYQGSPRSRIDDAHFEEKRVDCEEFTDFSVWH
ncbi:Acylphosphatase-like domain-containing protein [Jimgerdemannia flammicorona]|uniref:acylphosphatase n=1 Tax=Jimgerdemannia flammicorona TaxID=994334 RepID=A0A433QIR0_9FUNG|nr:Acylphosphatase-like domain-containing protein [Jimgerdemannia flammicorona]